MRLQVRCPNHVNGITIDPEPNWDFNSLLSELNSLENKLNATSSSTVPVPFIKAKSRELYNERRTRGFVMRLSDDDVDGITSSSDKEEEEEARNRRLVEAKRFTCDQIYLSDSDESDDESALEIRPCLMDGMGLVESALFEMTYEHQVGIKEEIRNRFSILETELLSESEKFTSALLRVEKYREARRDIDKKLDTQYQRKIAEALDDHLTAVQRDHEIRSQIEERRIRNDAAHEEAKRKEKALQEEKLRQEKARAEAEAKLRAEEAKRAALEAERKAAKEAAEREADENSKKKDAGGAQEKAAGHPRDAKSDSLKAQLEESISDGRKKSQSTGVVLRAAESAISIEQARLQKLKEIDVKNQALKSSPKEDLSRFERLISRIIRQIRGTKDNVRAKANELIKIFNDPKCPQSLSIATFAEKVVSHGKSHESATAFACGYVIVLVASQVQDALDLLLAELHKACIYTVPKHMMYIESVFGSKEAYYKAIGYQEEDGKIEDVKDYLKRLESYIRLYAALVQTEIPGIQNAHGLKDGWAWLARFLNTLPANAYTAVALNAFLQVAGFALFRKYKSQFVKLLNIISENFLHALKAREDLELKRVIAEISAYIEDKKYLQEPEGRSLQDALLSRDMVPDSEYQEPYQYQQSYRYQQPHRYQQPYHYPAGGYYY